MKIDFTQNLTNYDGAPIEEIHAKKGAIIVQGVQPSPADFEIVKVELFDIVRIAVFHEPLQNEPAFTFEEKMKQYEIVKAISLAKNAAELTVDDVALIKAKIKKFITSPQHMGVSLALIDAADK
jgi:hypothetical protein